MTKLINTLFARRAYLIREQLLHAQQMYTLNNKKITENKYSLYSNEINNIETKISKVLIDLNDKNAYLPFLL